MNEKSVNESNMNKNEHFGFVPKSNDSFICEVNKNMTEMKNQIETKFEQLFSFMLSQQQQTLEKITQNIDAKLSSIEQKYEILSNKIEESKKSIIQIQSSIQQVSQKTDTINDYTQLHLIIEHPFNGIIQKLTKQCGGNVHD